MSVTHYDHIKRDLQPKVRFRLWHQNTENPKEQCVLGVFYCLRFYDLWTIFGPGRLGSGIERCPRNLWSSDKTEYF